MTEVDSEIQQAIEPLVKVFTDLNCPFCFALHERMIKLEVYADWCFIEHAPELDSESVSAEQQALLKHEYSLVTQRAPDIRIECPEFCVNTRLAILTLISVQRYFPEHAASYQTALYRAYWQQGLDISDPQVLYDLLLAIGLPEVNVSQASREQQAAWQAEWEFGDFDHRIPALRSPDNQILLGLQHLDNIRSFFLHSSVDDHSYGESCNYHGDFSVTTFGLSELALRVNSKAGGLKLSAFDDVESLTKHVVSSRPDAVLLDYGLDSNIGFKGIRALKDKLPPVAECPLVYLNRQPSAGEEVHAFTLGASDYVALQDDVAPLIARLKQSILQSRSVQLLHRYAIVDGLTGLINKREFQQIVYREWRNACRNKDSLSLIMIDIDYFKLYNDTHGHCAGDDVLRRVAKAILGPLHRAHDIAARFGGEEFVVLLPSTHLDGLGFMCERLKNAISDLNIAHPMNSVIPKVSISLGGAFSMPHADQTPMELIEVADKALYQAKEKGRNGYRVRQLHSPNYH